MRCAGGLSVVGLVDENEALMLPEIDAPNHVSPFSSKPAYAMVTARAEIGQRRRNVAAAAMELRWKKPLRNALNIKIAWLVGRSHLANGEWLRWFWRRDTRRDRGSRHATFV
jgi:hypothetical protein